MGWNRPRFSRVRHPHFDADRSPFRMNVGCFIRKEHDCSKVFGASKSCFIACPTDDELEPTLELLSEKLMKHQIEPVIAVKERAYGQDIFCTKICGKIIESRFCVVILDDSISDGMNVPNPNVYYEYGLMTALRKHIIPLQKDGQRLAFNIQSYDTIKYSARNLAQELESAIRDAIKITDATESDSSPERISERRIERRLEVSGFAAKNHNWYLNSVVEDTLFRGFGCDVEHAYLYLGKIDTEDDITSYLEDLEVVLVRTEKKAAERMAKIEKVEKAIREAEESRGQGVRGLLDLGYHLEQAREQLPNDRGILENMGKIYVGFIVNSDVNTKRLKESADEMVREYDRYELCYSCDCSLKIGDAVIDLTVGGGA